MDDLLVKLISEKVILKYNDMTYQINIDKDKMITLFGELNNDWIKVENKILKDKLIAQLHSDNKNLEYNIISHIQSYNSEILYPTSNKNIIVSERIDDAQEDSLNIIIDNSVSYIFKGKIPNLSINNKKEDIDKISIEFLILKAFDYLILNESNDIFYKIDLLTYNFTKHNKYMAIRNKKIDYIEEIKRIDDLNQDQKYSALMKFYTIFSSQFNYIGFGDKQQIPLKITELSYNGVDNSYKTYGVGITPFDSVLDCFKSVVNKFSGGIKAIFSINDLNEQIALMIYNRYEFNKKKYEIKDMINCLANDFDKKMLLDINDIDMYEFFFDKGEFDYYYGSVYFNNQMIFENCKKSIQEVIENIIYHTYLVNKYHYQSFELYVDEIGESLYQRIYDMDSSLYDFLDNNNIKILIEVLEVPNIENGISLFKLKVEDD